MKIIILILEVLFLLFTINIADAFECKDEIPIYPPTIQLVNEKGENLTFRKKPKLDLSKICLSIKKDSSLGTGYKVPLDVSEADKMLREYLPMDIYIRIFENYKEIAQVGLSSRDPGLNERFGDIAMFFNSAWDLKKNSYLVNDFEKKKNYYDRFIGLLESIENHNKKSSRS